MANPYIWGLIPPEVARGTQGLIQAANYIVSRYPELGFVEEILRLAPNPPSTHLGAAPGSVPHRLRPVRPNINDIMGEMRDTNAVSLRSYRYRQYSVGEAQQILLSRCPGLDFSNIHLSTHCDWSALANLVRNPSVLRLAAFTFTHQQNYAGIAGRSAITAEVGDWTFQGHNVLSMYNMGSEDFSRHLFDMLRNNPDGILDTTPNLRGIFLEMQNIQSLSLLIQVMINMINAVRSGSSVRVRMTILVHREMVNPHGNQTISRYFYLSVPQGFQVMEFDINSSTADILETLTRSLYEPLRPDSTPGSSYRREDDEIIVTSLKFWPIASGVVAPQLLGQLFPGWIPTSRDLALQRIVSSQMIYFFQQLYARAPPPSKYFSDKLALATGLSNIRNACLLETFVYCYVIDHSMALSVQQKRNATRKVIREFVRDNPEAYKTLLDSTVYAGLLYLMKKFEVRGVSFCYFDGAGKRPQLAPLYIEADAYYEDFEYSIVPVEDFENPETVDTLTIVYYQAHTAPSTFRLYDRAIHDQGTKYLRLQRRARDDPPEPFLLKPGLPRRPRTIVSATPTSRTPSQPWPPYGYYDEECSTVFMGWDVETTTCEECGFRTQHPMCVSFGGMDPEHTVTFYGLECPRRERQDPNYRGCLRQGLEWFNTHGYYDPAERKGHQQGRHYEVCLVDFNGAGFDRFFLLPAVQRFGWRPQVTMMAGCILQMTFGNVRMLDMMRHYPGSLDSAYKTFTAHPPEDFPPPNTRKWRCFPYDLPWDTILQASEVDPTFTMDYEEMRDMKYWGSKVTDEKFPNIPADSPPEDHNVNWFKQTFGHARFPAKQLLGEYCESDVYILMYCTVRHLREVAVGEINGKKFDTKKALTVAAATFKVFKQAFLSRTLTSPDFKISTGIFHSDGRPFKLLEVLECGKKGGLVNSFIRTSDNDRYKAAWEASGHPHRILYTDFNSSYPRVLRDCKLPIELTHIENHPEGILITDPDTQLEDTNLYNADILYPGTECGLMLKLGGYCFQPTHCPYIYYDPKLKDERLSMHYGIGLKFAAKVKGARVIIYNTLHFVSENIFSEFATYFYNMRLREGKGKDPVTFQRIPGIEPNKLLDETCKLKMNSAYGKLLQNPVSHHEFCYDGLASLNDEMMEGLIDFNVVPGIGENETFLLLETYTPTDSYLGQFVATGACITEYARLFLEQYIHAVSQLKNRLGEPCLVYYGDTDSLFFDEPDPNLPGTQAFKELYWDDNELGKMKLEAVFSLFGCGAKKQWAAVMEGTGEVKMAQKGIPHKKDRAALVKDAETDKMRPITGRDIIDIVHKRAKLTATLGESFKHTLQDGVRKHSAYTRTITTNNHSRCFEGDFSRPWRCPLEFAAHLEEVQARGGEGENEELDMVDVGEEGEEEE